MRTTAVGNVALIGVGVTGANLAMCMAFGLGSVALVMGIGMVMLGLIAVKEQRR